MYAVRCEPVDYVSLATLHEGSPLKTIDALFGLRCRSHLCPGSDPPGRPSLTCLRMIADDVKPMNFGVHTAWQKANDCKEWRRVMGTATLQSE